MTEPIIEVDQVSVLFPRSATPALRDVSLTIERGAFVALVGPSGSGKTSLLKAVNGLIQPTSGTLRFEGTDIRTQDGPTLRRRMGYSIQGAGLFPHMSVGENIGIIPDLMGWPRHEIRARVDELLDLVELPRSFALRAPGELSGGQAQRVGVARALAVRPPVMLMDEPFGALDPLTRESVAQSYNAIHRRLGLTTLMVTHDIEEALLLADKIAVISTGQLVAYDTPTAFMHGRAPSMVAEMIAIPRTRAERLHRMSGDGAGL
jgi:osmoprotectant transport system ATP-binding protein